MKYSVTVGPRTFEVEVKGDHVWVDGKPRTATLTNIPHTPLRHVALDGRSRTVLVQRDGDGWLVQLPGDRWTVIVEDERARRLRELTGQQGAKAAGGVVKAPMPGLVLRLEVEEGQAIEPGAGVVVLEAMKMENEIKSPAGGVVKAIRVKPGQAVEKGAVLVEVEGSTDRRIDGS